ncbi:hypothetical protein JHW45_16010 [Paracoccus stylophorae]|uniref:Uncharacterized protein n=1 Tax=Paracoccus stylophorae TaxID=659350 RepID=A0ABY7SWF6_9RHOB|nr:hypothetical protein [Paracoccus stylophorae]WCR10536.1 hypothetical protein JHW45_16010 [Paracoccus stylophorae]
MTAEGGERPPPFSAWNTVSVGPGLQTGRAQSSSTVSLWYLTRTLQVDFAGLLEYQQVSQIRVPGAHEVPIIGNGRFCHELNCAKIAGAADARQFS